MAKEEEFAMIEELENSYVAKIQLVGNTTIHFEELGTTESSNNSYVSWNKHELKAFIEELQKLHSKMI